MQVVTLILFGAASLAAASPAKPREIVRSRHHYKDWYFATFDAARVSFANRGEIDAVAIVIATRAGVVLVGGGFLQHPQGFRVTGSERAALELLKDERIASVEEEGDFFRAMEPIAGSYIVELTPGLFGTDWPSPADVQAVAEELVSQYGGRVKASWVPGGGGFGALGMPAEGARALSRDPHVRSVSEDTLVTIGDPLPSPFRPECLHPQGIPRTGLPVLDELLKEPACRSPLDESLLR